MSISAKIDNNKTKGIVKKVVSLLILTIRHNYCSINLNDCMLFDKLIV